MESFDLQQTFRLFARNDEAEVYDLSAIFSAFVMTALIAIIHQYIH
jgi:hypothetical protein